MARWWIEPYNAEKHADMMRGVVDGVYTFDLDMTPPDPLIEKDVYFVRVAGFTLQFLELRHLEIAIEYFSRPLKGSTRAREGVNSADHWEVQRWFERLPKGLERKERKVEVAKTLKQALAEFQK